MPVSRRLKCSHDPLQTIVSDWCLHIFWQHYIADCLHLRLDQSLTSIIFAQPCSSYYVCQYISLQPLSICRVHLVALHSLPFLQTAIGHWSEMMFPLFSILKQEPAFKRPPTQFMLLHLKRVHLMEWARAVMSVALGVKVHEDLPPMLMQQETNSVWTQIREQPACLAYSLCRCILQVYDDLSIEAETVRHCFTVCWSMHWSHCKF